MEKIAGVCVGIGIFFLFRKKDNCSVFNRQSHKFLPLKERIWHCDTLTYLTVQSSTNTLGRTTDFACLLFFYLFISLVCTFLIPFLLATAVSAACIA